MANASSRSHAHAPRRPSPATVFFWPAAAFDTVLKTQKAQWDAYSAWQQSLLVWTKDLWEQWACRFAGGVPIDG